MDHMIVRDAFWLEDLRRELAVGALVTIVPEYLGTSKKPPTEVELEATSPKVPPPASADAIAKVFYVTVLLPVSGFRIYEEKAEFFKGGFDR